MSFGLFVVARKDDAGQGKFPRVRGRPIPAPRKEEFCLFVCLFFGRKHRKNSTHMQKLESKGKFIRKGITLHRDRE